MKAVIGSLSRRAVRACGLGVLLLFLTAGLRAEEEATESRSQPRVFEALRAEVETAVAQGSLPAGTATAADELAFDLERELIRRDAEIEVLRLEAARFEGDAQQQALIC